MGDRLLSAIEKKDAETLSVLRATNEQALLNLMTQTKQAQVDEASSNIDNLQKSQEITQAKLDYYNSALILP